MRIVFISQKQSLLNKIEGTINYYDYVYFKATVVGFCQNIHFPRCAVCYLS